MSGELWYLPCLSSLLYKSNILICDSPLRSHSGQVSGVGGQEMVSCGIVQSDRLIELQFTRLPGLVGVPGFMSLLTLSRPLAPFGKLARSCQPRCSLPASTPEAALADPCLLPGTTCLQGRAISPLCHGPCLSDGGPQSDSWVNVSWVCLF